MDVSEFVKTTLIQVIEGVTAAMDHTKHHPARALINPTDDHIGYAEPTKIQFDVAVTVQEDAAIKGGASIQVFGEKFGTDANKGTTNTAVSRITFDVPVSLPSVAKEKYPDRGSRPRQAATDDGF